MDRSKKFYAGFIFLLFAGLLGWYGNHYINEQRSLRLSKEVRKASELLDSWHGEGEILANAKKILDNVLSENPDEYSALMELGRYYSLNGYSQEKNVSNGHYTYSIGEFVPGSLEDAIRVTERSIAINPSFSEGYISLGYLYLQKNQLAAAKDALEHAEKLGTTDLRLNLHYGYLEDVLGNSEAAIRRYKNVEKSGTQNKKILFLANTKLINHYINTGNYGQAKNCYKKNIEMDPKNAWAKSNFSEFLRTQTGDFSEAVQYAREALAIMNYGNGRKDLALALYEDWANQIVNHGKSEIDAQPLYDEAFNIFPKLDYVMVYEGSFRTATALVKLLQKRGVSIDTKVDDGSTALMIASNTGRTEAVKTLLSLGADPNLVADTGWTALLGAVDEGHEEIVRSLLASGADPKQNINGADAATLAESHGNTELANFIRSYQALLKKS